MSTSRDKDAGWGAGGAGDGAWGPPAAAAAAGVTAAMVELPCNRWHVCFGLWWNLQHLLRRALRQREWHRRTTLLPVAQPSPLALFRLRSSLMSLLLMYKDPGQLC